MRTIAGQYQSVIWATRFELRKLVIVAYTERRLCQREHEASSISRDANHWLAMCMK